MINLKELAREIEGWTKQTTQERVEFTRMVTTKEERKPRTWQERIGKLCGKHYREVIETPEPYFKIVDMEVDTPRYCVMQKAHNEDKGDMTTLQWLAGEKRNDTELWKALSTGS